MTTRDKLKALAANLWWSWQPEAMDLFIRLNATAFECANNNPVAALTAAHTEVLEDPDFIRDVDRVYDEFEAYMHAPPRYTDAPRTSYFCMEYGLHESLPLYSGGLGVLAGDHTKAASDLGLPFTAVGLFLRQGYFEQHFDAAGWQQATHIALNPAHHPMTLVRDAEGEPLTVQVHIGMQPLHLKAWRLDVGRVPLYLLDADLVVNPEPLRSVTHALYQGGNEQRLQQEIILGIGGVRLLRALGIESDVYHLNEGHCAFLTLELLRERLEAGKVRSAAEDWVRERCVFTTHTPVPAGHDRFIPSRFFRQMSGFCEEIGMSEEDLMAYGRIDHNDEHESFTMTVLGLNLSRRANGVSALNGEVARGQWHHLFPDRPIGEVPISHITNGIHLPTWTAPHARNFLTEHLGAWETRQEPAFWSSIADLSDEELWRYRTTLRGLLIDFIRGRAPYQTLQQETGLNPDALTLGFARRFATYKRAPLLFHDVDRAAHLFSLADRPIQIVYAGKAHPADAGGKRFIQQIHEMSQHPAFVGKVVFLENYNMEIGRMLISGCDVWLNNPRRPMEASGTSGQKIAVHGGLNLSILDGWWPEGYDGQNGWVIGGDGEYIDQATHDAEDAFSLYEMLEHHVIPTFYNRDEQGIPREWVARMRRALQTLPAHFSAQRMVSQYVEEMYMNRKSMQSAA